MEERTFKEKLLSTIFRISSSIEDLATTIRAFDKSYRPGSLKEEIEERTEKQRREERERTQIDLIVEQNKRLIFQNKVLFWTLIVGIISLLIQAGLSIAKLLLNP